MPSMTPRERWLAVLHRRTPDWLPMDYWGTPEATDKVLRHLGVPDVEAMDAALHIDRPAIVGDRYVGPPVAADADVYGCRYAPVAYGSGVYRECVGHPLGGYDTPAQIEAHYRWPEPDWFDPASIPDQIAAHPDRLIRFDMAGLYTQYTYLRGIEQAFIDFALHQDLVAYCMARMCDLQWERARRVFEAAGGGIQLACIAHDLGSQLDLLCDPVTVRRLFIPGIRRLAELAHQHGAFVFLHSDGAIRRAIPDLIGAGVDVLNPIQWRCAGMDRRELKREFGSDLIFHGAMDNQDTLVYGSVAEVRAEVRENMDILGAGGGYILAPCHCIQPVSPAESIIAMYEAGYAWGQGCQAAPR
jgi:uroporphyrinogen decarboxylase